MNTLQFDLQYKRDGVWCLVEQYKLLSLFNINLIIQKGEYRIHDNVLNTVIAEIKIN